MDSKLQAWLERVVVKNDVTGFENVPKFILDGIITYLKNDIPTKIFTSAPTPDDILLLHSQIQLLQDKFF